MTLPFRWPAASLSSARAISDIPFGSIDWLKLSPPSSENQTVVQVLKPENTTRPRYAPPIRRRDSQYYCEREYQYYCYRGCQ